MEAESAVKKIESVVEKFTKLEISKFSLSEMINGVNGKTDAGLFIAVISGLTGCMGFTSAGLVLLIQSIKKEPGQSLSGELTTIMTQSALIIAGSLSFLGYHRGTKDQPIQQTNV